MRNQNRSRGDGRRAWSSVGILSMSLAAASARGADWPQWRGPEGNDLSREDRAPLTWSETENLAWKLELPDWGASTPVTWGDRIFLTGQTEEDKGLWLTCVGREEGKVLWRRQVAQGDLPSHREHNMASPSPVTDGRSVWALFGTGDLACYDASGNKTWSRRLTDDHGAYTCRMGMASSLALHGELLILLCVNAQGPSYVLALDKSTGKEVWKTDYRPPAQGRREDSYSSPMIFRAGDRDLLAVSGDDHVALFDPKEGRPLWRLGGLEGGRLIGVPVIHDGLLLVNSAARGQTVMGIRLGRKPDLSDTSKVWDYRKSTPDVPSLLAYRDRVYWVNDQGIACCVRLDAGAEVWKNRVEGKYRASPLIAQDRLYLINVDGKATVLKTGDAFEVLASNQLEGRDFYSSPVLSNGRLLLRSRTHLYCVNP